MKTVFNMTTDYYDLMRFENTAALDDLLRGFDGVELSYFGEDTRGIIRREHVVGLHMQQFACWLELWEGNKDALLREFGTMDEIRRHYGGTERSSIIEKLRQELKLAVQLEAEYVVFHVSDVTVEETMTRRYHRSDEEVIDATCELLNILFDDTPPVRLLLENLWYPGLTFTRPEMTRRLLDGVKHKDTGIILDTGHLLHTNTSLRTQEDSLRYINRMLDEHGGLCDKIRAVHLNQSLTGEYAEKVKKSTPQFAESFDDRVTQMFKYIFQIDLHMPFTCRGVDELIRRIAPDHVTFEFITENLEQHKRYLREQRAALGMI